MKIGILGGTFDPIHTGHIILAEEVKKALRLDEIWFMPAGNPYFKKGAEVLPACHRKEMVERAIEGKEGYRLSSVEMDRIGETYTFDTLRELKEGAAKSDELYFILGWDNLANFYKWKNAGKILNLCRLAAVPRVGQKVPDVEALDKKVKGIKEKAVLLSKPEVDISSSLVRERIKESLPFKHLVPESVYNYIVENNLYKQS